MRKVSEYNIDNHISFKKQLLNWASKFNRVAFLDSNDYYKQNSSKVDYHTYDCIVAIDSISELQSTNDSFNELKQFINLHKDWCFGHFSYDLKNEVENLRSENSDNLYFPEISFFIPKYVFIINDNKLRIEHYSNSEEIDNIYNDISLADINKKATRNEITINSRHTQSEYIDIINKLKYHIQRGDIYELNFCQEFYSKNSIIDPIETYQKLTDISPTPFACYYKIGDKHLLSASPERYIKKENNKIISQPIKGTIKRGKTSEEDAENKKALLNDPKERTENVMIVDLVRNDMSKTAAKGSVKVEELFGVYPFKQVYQLISTIVSELDNKYHPVDVIKNSFPMGSMTGAPKIRAMEIIEEFEQTKRGLYSGSVGYFTPNLDFDFNVIIRSILYNEANKYLSFIVGGAITNNSVPEKEYEECLVKAEAIRNLFDLEF